MIQLTRLNGEQLYINAFQVEAVDANPDTRLTLTSGRQIYIKETPDVVRSAMLRWFRSMHAPGSDREV
jgi:flagellar protein FlbD